MISLSFAKTDSDLFGRSKWWGFPDMPEELEYPEVPVNVDGEMYYDPLTFVYDSRRSFCPLLSQQATPRYLLILQ